MIKIKTPDEIEKMAASGKILAATMQRLLEKAKIGVTTLELDKLAEDYILAAGAKPSFKLEKDYYHTTCMCVNDAVVHGIPNDYKLQKGDRLGIDCGAVLDGWHSDASWSVMVEEEPSTFLKVGQKALELAIEQCVVGNHVGHVSKMIDDVVTQAGYSPVKALVGHGIGRELHEDPEVPCYLRGEIENTPELKPGMVIAVEVIYNMGESPVVYGGNDGWTIVTRDGSLSGLFEHTVAITENGPRVLTPIKLGLTAV
ncbi:type I methionyl aminopeptidase [Candidatus Microgenomates bacterium]|nr:type I methionyl aminopeptidase [Candidatus Microgenomates bacterium]